MGSNVPITPLTAEQAIRLELTKITAVLERMEKTLEYINGALQRIAGQPRQ